MTGFRETVLPSCWFERRLRAVQDLPFLVGADLIPQGRRPQVRFVVSPEARAEFLQRLRTLAEGLPIAAQLDWDLTEANDTHQTLHGPTDHTMLVTPSTPAANGTAPSY